MMCSCIYVNDVHVVNTNNLLLNEIRELTMTDISCEFLLYGSADLGIEIRKKVFDAVHRFIDETGRFLDRAYVAS